MKLLLLLVFMAFIGFDEGQKNRNYWLRLGKEQLRKAVKQFTGVDQGRAKNVIVFIGESMGPTTVAAARIYKCRKQKKTEGCQLSFEQLPCTGFSRTYCVDKHVPDCAASATAILTGIKTKFETIGLDGTVEIKECKQNLLDKAIVTSIANWAQNKLKSVGLVTNTKVTHATSAALYAHTPNKNWDCNNVPNKYKKCFKDVATQLVEDYPGKNFKVILGGGKDYMGLTKTQECTRNNNLVHIWEKSKSRERYAFVQNVNELMKVNPKKVEFLLGLFTDGHMHYNLESDKSTLPSLSQMTHTALRILQRNPEGYLLLVVNGLIQFAHHHNHITLALSETIELDNAIKLAIENTKVDETLIIVTSNVAEGLTLLGYNGNNADIPGALQSPSAEWNNLFYSVGPGNEKRNNKTDSIFYQAKSAFRSEEAVGSGEDVMVYASGPGASLLVGSYEQSYIAHAISYAAGITAQAKNTSPSLVLTFLSVYFLYILLTHNVELYVTHKKEIL